MLQRKTQNECGSRSTFLRLIEEYKVQPIGRSWIMSIGLGLVVSILAVAACLTLVRSLGNRLRSADYSEVPVKLEALHKQLDYVLELARRGSFPSRRFDHSSVGAPLVEAKLLEIRRDVSIYDSIHHRLPVSFEELEGMRLPSNWEKNVEKFEWECQIFPLTADSSILNCDSWHRPDENQLNTLVHSFDPQTGRFYKVRGHVLLFIPPPTVGIPLSAKTKN